MKKKFDYILYYLTQFKILYFINEPNINYAFEWNKFITGYYNKIYFNDEKQYYGAAHFKFDQKKFKNNKKGLGMKMFSIL